MVQVLFGNAHAVVLDAHFHSSRVRVRNGDLDLAPVIDCRKRVVDDVQEYLLELAAIAFDRRQVLFDVERDVEVAVAGLLFEEAQYVLEKNLQIDSLSHDVHMLGKAEQTVRDRSAAHDRFEYCVHQTDHLFLRWKRVGEGQQVFVETRLFPDDCQWVVDFVSHPRCQSANGCHFVRVFQPVIRGRTLQIRLAGTIDHVPRAKKHNGQNKQNADRQECDKVPSQ